MKVLETLGSGGFGVVELVEDSDGNQFARKRFSVAQPLPPEMIENVRKRFVREARLQSGITHRHIVQIVHTELDGDAPSYLMPVAVSTLERDINEGTVTHEKLLGVVSDIAAGLNEMHTMEMYHRDLKPQNVLRFEAEDGTSFYAISDFGFVSLNDSRLSTLTHTGMAKGTDYYTAPEITKDLRLANASTDIYSLGCIIHDVVGTSDRVPCAEIKEDGAFGPLLRNCTRSANNKRFKTVAAVRDVLASIDADLPPAENQTTVNFIEALENDDLKKNVVEQIAEFCEDNVDTDDGNLVFRRITIENITKFYELDEQSANEIGLHFASWVADGSFGFDYCDVLADRLQTFFSHGDLALKSECLLSMLKMGTSHNRWYVEGKFLRFAGPDMDETLAKRFIVELRAVGDEICDQIEHLERSISANRSSLHPLIVSALGSICP